MLIYNGRKAGQTARNQLASIMLSAIRAGLLDNPICKYLICLKGSCLTSAFQLLVTATEGTAYAHNKVGDVQPHDNI